MPATPNIICEETLLREPTGTSALVTKQTYLPPGKYTARLTDSALLHVSGCVAKDLVHEPPSFSLFEETSVSQLDKELREYTYEVYTVSLSLEDFVLEGNKYSFVL